MKKRYILRTILVTIGVLALLVCAFVAEQYYRWHICNFRAKDGESHSYNIYAGASIDSVLDLLRKDYEISSETDLSLHMRFLVFNRPEPGHYRFDAQMGDRELIERLKYGRQTPVRILGDHLEHGLFAEVMPEDAAASVALFLAAVRGEADHAAGDEFHDLALGRCGLRSDPFRRRGVYPAAGDLLIVILQIVHCTERQ